VIICLAVLLEFQFVTERWTDRQTQGYSIYRASIGTASRGKVSPLTVGLTVELYAPRSYSFLQHFLYMLVNIFTFNVLWKVTFCHKTRCVCNVWRQNSCDKFYKVV